MLARLSCFLFGAALAHAQSGDLRGLWKAEGKAYLNLETAGVIFDPPSAKIPDSPVQMFIRRGPNGRFELFFIDVKYGYDLADFQFYKAWCLMNV